ncbi:MAG: PQQ-dependent sugar dehydrogenase [Planctomycetes bacterium]|nr:PQQ-dependent sugar dehydrogenase [Planctomycetota bacterium]
MSAEVRSTGLIQSKPVALSALQAIVWASLVAIAVAQGEKRELRGRAVQRAEVGIKERVPWTTSRVTGSPEPPAKYVVERVFPSLTFDQPAEMTTIPGTDRLIVAEVKGKLYTFVNQPDAAETSRDLFADLTPLHPDFHQVYGLTFHPRFAENRYCYITYVLKPDIPEGTRVSRFTVSDTDPPKLELASEQVLITWVSGGHNGGHLQFGPDGYLYITTGDGGAAFPPDGRNTGQDVSDLLASILRVDLDHPAAGTLYGIPADNPFVSHPGARGEVWAYGFRNPWKMCFDPADGSLWTGDVGWEQWEMVYRVERGGNYGWSLVEASQPVHQERERGPTPILPPAVAHSHTESRSITGGYFYRSSRLPELRGAYIYGDYVTGKVWALRHQADKITWHEELLDTPLQIVSFGQDRQGEMYLVDYAGTLHRLAANPRQTANTDFPRKLSETGLFESVADHRPAPGVIPYSINAEPWADGTVAERFVAVPGLTQLGVFKQSNVQVGHIAGEWEFPKDGVLVKTVSLDLEPGSPASRRRLETQVLHYDVDTWKAYNYVWNDEQTDAELSFEGADRVLSVADSAAPGGRRQQTWHHASRTECLLCHTTRAGSVHGFRMPQLARDHDYRGVMADQLRTFEHIGLFAEPAPSDRTAWPDPHDPSADLSSRARAYLHVNCGHCHRRGGGGSAFFDVQYDFPLSKTALLGTRPTQGTFGIHDAQIVAPGDPYRSVLYYRMSKLGHGRMPQFGSQVVDPQGTKLIHDWIASLPADRESRALASVARLQAEEAALACVKAGETVDEAASQAIDRLLSTASGGMRLATALESQRLGEGVRQAVIARGTSHADAVIRDLFERYLPEEQRVKRLGSVIRPTELLALLGDAERGKALFLSEGVQCRNCHRLGEQGQVLGPDLTQIGRKFTKQQLLESMLDPSKAIDPQFVTYLVETTDGRVLTGLLVERSETEVILRNAQNQAIRTPSVQIERITPQQKSLMPDLLLRDLTAQQVADLLELLSTAK